MVRIFLLIGFIGPYFLWALNPLHEAKYQLYPRDFKNNRTEFAVGAYTHWQGDLNLPLQVIFGLNNSLEFGARLNFDSEGKKFTFSDLKTTLDIGLLANLRNGHLLQIDAIMGIGHSKQGMNVSYSLFQSVTKKFIAGWQMQGSFFSGLNAGTPIIIELGFYPRFKLTKAIHPIGSITYSSSPTDIVDYSAFDVAPGVEIFLADYSRLLALVYFGAAGAKSENDILWKLGWTHDF